MRQLLFNVASQGKETVGSVNKMTLEIYLYFNMILHLALKELHVRLDRHGWKISLHLLCG